MSVSASTAQDLRELRSTARGFLRDRFPSAHIRALADAGAAGDPVIWRQMSEQLALQGIAIPEARGGQGFGPKELAVIVEELGRALAVTPYLATVGWVGQILSLAAPSPVLDRWLADIAGGSSTATVAVAEADGCWPPADLRTRAEPAGDRWQVSGEKWFVPYGATADLLLVLARTPDGQACLFGIEDTNGRHCEPLQSLDITRPLARLSMFEAPAIYVGNFALVERALDLIRLSVAWEQLGIAQRCLDMAVDYSKVRVQFGRPIGSFQALKHKCADIVTALEAARSATTFATAVAADGPATELPAAAVLASAAASEAAVRAAKENIQMHGGMGFTWEHDAHLFLRRAKASQLLLGPPATQRERLADVLEI